MAGADPKVTQSSSPAFNYRDPRSYDLNIEGTYNQSGLDGANNSHSGGGVGISAGPRFKVLPKLTISGLFRYDFSSLSRGRGSDTDSNLSVHGFGVEGKISYQLILNLVSIGANIFLGGAKYDASAVQIGGFRELVPLSSLAFRFGAGVQVGIWDDVFSIGFRFLYDTGVNLNFNADRDAGFADKSASAQIIQPTVGVNVTRLACKIPRLCREPEDVVASEEATPAPAAPAAPAAPVIPAPKASAEPSPVVSSKTGMALFEEQLAKAQAEVGAAKSAENSSREELKVLVRDLRGSSEVEARKRVRSVRNFWREANKSRDKIDVIVIKLREEIENIKGVAEKRKAENLLAKIQKQANVANEHARLAWDNANKAFTLYNSKYGKKIPLEFSDVKPKQRAKVFTKPEVSAEAVKVRIPRKKTPVKVQAAGEDAKPTEAEKAQQAEAEKAQQAEADKAKQAEADKAKQAEADKAKKVAPKPTGGHKVEEDDDDKGCIGCPKK